jgi:hypothetical protein
MEKKNVKPSIGLWKEIRSQNAGLIAQFDNFRETMLFDLLGGSHSISKL